MLSLNLKARNSKGFTLIEMLLALAVFAYAASSILAVLGQTAKNLSELEQMTFASWVANDRLTELQVDKTWPPQNKAKGERELAGQKWHWSQLVEKTADNNLRKVSVEVRLDPGSRGSLYTLSTFVSKNQDKVL